MTIGFLISGTYFFYAGIYVTIGRGRVALLYICIREDPEPWVEKGGNHDFYGNIPGNPDACPHRPWPRRSRDLSMTGKKKRIGKSERLRFMSGPRLLPPALFT